MKNKASIKTVIIAGGKGMRMGEITRTIPKPMLTISGKPVLEHQINNLNQNGIEDIYILSGHLSDSIIDYFGDGRAFGVNIAHVIEKEPLGTSGAVKQLEHILNERFIVFYGDVIFNIDLESFIKFDLEASSIATIIIHPNDHPYDSDLIEIDENNVVTAIHSKPHDTNKYYRNLVSAAAYILSPDIFKYIPENKPTDFGKDIFPLLLKSNETIRAYKTAEYIKDIGTADRMAHVSTDINNGKLNSFSKKNKRPAIFMDRDGTLVVEKDLLHEADNLEIYPFTTQALKKINSSVFMSFLVTNQPVVARNLCDIKTVQHIHNKIETVLGKSGAYFNDIYFCPHHPDKGYPEENKDYKIDCDCRKPKIGMIKKAVEEYNVDIDNSWFIGDRTTDIQTGINAGLRTILVRTGKGGQDGKFQCTPDYVFDNMEMGVDFILK